ncbi:DNA primase [Candidatus Woesearchaeota archaeon]|nr:DNA primase [Candidatus Woesearchaeota archaeon]
MAKISPVSAKYIVQATIDIDGVVDRPDVIGAIFGQTEGLLGEDLELRELQRSGRIGRIEVTSETRGGKTRGNIIIPSSLDKAETAIVGAALEVIQRIGPCNAKIKVEKIEDVRISKRQFVTERAKQLLKQLMDASMPDSQELADEVAASVRALEIREYGRERLPAGPAVEESQEIIVVEGRADVLTLLKHGFKNAIAINGTSIPETIKELCKHKETTVFVDGDRGGDLIIKELLSVTDIDFVTKAPDGKEVEELTKKEIHKALRSRIAAEQVKMDMPAASPSVQQNSLRQNMRGPVRPAGRAPTRPSAPVQRAASAAPVKKVKLSDNEKKLFIDMLNDLVGTRGAYLLDQKLSMLGKVPLPELESTLKNVTNVYAVVFDGVIDKNIVKTAEKADVKFLVAMDNQVKATETPVNLLTINDI